MADVSAIRDGIKTRLETITALVGRSYDNWPDSILCPAAIVKPVRWDYRLAIGNVNRAVFEIIFLAAPAQNGLARGQETLDGYLDDTGASSIKAALEGGKTLGGNATTLQVPGWRDYGIIDVNDIPYVGVVFDLEVWP